jgi:hypothetical protein
MSTNFSGSAMAVTPSTVRDQLADVARRFASSSNQDLAASEPLAGHGGSQRIAIPASTGKRNRTRC